ncbi:hypothetical protein CC80DRAFT_397754, partial [Byssothecium circinans]
GLRFPCPLADEHNCPKTFSSSKMAKAHSHIHSGVQIPCPLAKGYGCDLMFKTQEYARNHKKLHTHPFICPRKDCIRRFQSFGDTLQHADDPNHQVPELFLCPVQMCRSATIGKPLNGHDIKWHRNLHVQLGHIDSTDFIPQAAKEQQLHSDISLYSLIQQHERLDLTARSSREELALGIAEDDGDLDVNETDLKDIYNAIDSDDNDHQDMQDDDEMQEAFPKDGGLLQELEYPSELLSQEHLQRRESRGSGILRLANRCAGPQNSVCASRNCDRLPVHGCAYCPLHLSNLLQNSHKSIHNHSITQLQEMFKSAIRKEWRIQPQYDVVRKRTKEILQSKRPGTDLIILDDEFSPASQQLWDSLPFWSHISQFKAKEVYSSARNTSLEHMDVDEVAFRLRQVGISPSTVIIVYHATNFDLKLLTRFLESAGYFGYLPTEENCIPIVNVLRPHLSDRMSSGRRFPLKLEVPCPLMFPRHSLVGMNHQALADCQQTRLVCMAYEELCKPVAERGEEWRPDAVARSSQRSILDWLQDSP